jgi:hypothetical protein
MKRLIMLGSTVLLAACADSVTAPSKSVAPAGQPSFAVVTSNVISNNWKVYNGEPATKSFWDINKAQLDGTGGVQFPIQQFLTATTGSFAIYLLNNYSVDMTGKTLSADATWTAGTYDTRSGTGGYVRLVFISAMGNYNSNDYWWSTGNAAPLALFLGAGSAGTLTASLLDCNLWSNQSGKSACDTTTNWVEWQGDIVALSPADGFTNATKNVKQVGLAFGSAGSYASGVALDGGTGIFDMTSFTITP